MAETKKADARLPRAPAQRIPRKGSASRRVAKPIATVKRNWPAIIAAWRADADERSEHVRRLTWAALAMEVTHV